jgi:hypothetical protein
VRPGAALGHDTAVCELAIGGSSSTVAVATRQKRRADLGSGTVAPDDERWRGREGHATDRSKRQGRDSLRPKLPTVPGERDMPYTVDFNSVSTVGLESSPFADALAGLRANEARYFKNKYDHDFTVEPASDAEATVEWVHRILKEERDIAISSRPLQATSFQVENVRIAYVFYESGLSVNVMYTVDGPDKRAVGFKLSEGMDIPAELESRFKFARQKSKLAGTIRGSYFVIKNEY